MAPKKVLLAEDDADDRAFFREFLQLRKDLVLLPMVENGVEVFEYLNTTDTDAALPDAIILDQNMPKQNGLQTLRLLKAADRYAAIPVMVYSTYADEKLKRDSVASGAALVVPKPVSPDGYNRMLDDLLGLLQ